MSQANDPATNTPNRVLNICDPSASRSQSARALCHGTGDTASVGAGAEEIVCLTASGGLTPVHLRLKATHGRPLQLLSQPRCSSIANPCGHCDSGLAGSQSKQI